MADLKVNAPELPAPRWDEISAQEWTLSYNKKADVLNVRTRQPRAAISVEVDGIWVRLDPSTGEVLGFEIEDFRRVFLAKHAELASGWRDVQSRRVPEGTRRSWLETLVAFIRSILSDSHPHQGRLLHA